ncbi:hypothetical protein ACHQM5_007025 [Ranunculus cassubicifolius]
MKGDEPGKDQDLNDDIPDIIFAKRRCCFCIPCFRLERSTTVGSPWWERIGESEEKWWKKPWNAVLKVREWSEIMAGPKWKTFIRRFNKKSGCGGGGIGGGGRHGKFQYDPLSYSLNFDEGLAQSDYVEDDDHVFRDFSSRYAAIPNSAKSSMDLGKDAPSFI